MASQLPRNKKSRVKPPKSRPGSTSAISQLPPVDSLSSLSAFSPKGDLFAHISLAIDKHRLRVYNTVTGQAVSEYSIDDARITALSWINFDLATVKEDASSPTKKRKKSNPTIPSPTSQSVQAVTLGLSNGSISFFSSTHGRALHTMSNPSSTAPILSLDSSQEKGQTIIWTSSQDSSIRAWQLASSSIIGTWKTDDKIPFSVIALRSENDGEPEILAANHSIRLLSVSETSQELCTFTGHVSSIKSLHWDTSKPIPTRFISIAESDRNANVWEVLRGGPGSRIEGKMVASIPLESDVRQVSLSPSSESTTLLAVSSSGTLSIFSLPHEIPSPSPAKKLKHSIPLLTPHSTISVAISKKSESLSATAGTTIVSASFTPEEGRVQIVRLAGGVKPVFDIVEYLDDDGQFIPEVKIKHKDLSLVNSASGDAIIANIRYAEPPSLPVRSGNELGLGVHDIIEDLDGELDVDLAELTLGQRLRGLPVGDHIESSGEDLSKEVQPVQTAPSRRKKKSNQLPVPANSLTLTLIQALHSADTKLLETCLVHSDVTLIQNTVRRLPPQLAVPLLMACVERLGRGYRASIGKGGGGGASSQRGTSIIAWIRAVLIMHSGHLMTMPDLVARLAGLHTTLTTRLSLQDQLLSLSGRLDLVLSQIEMRSSTAPTPLVQRKGEKKSDGSRYVEGGSSEDEQMEVRVETGEEEGSVEEVELGSDKLDELSESEEDGGDEDEDDEGEDDGEDDGDEDGSGSESGGVHINGFIDDQAEENWDDEDSGSE